ncbi:MAG: SIMPL domain-containing protein [Salaquimonas sp.]
MSYFKTSSRIAVLTLGLTIAPLLTSGHFHTTAIAAEQQISRINVTGEGQVMLAPDIATLQLGVLSEGETAREALTQNNELMGQIVAAMKEAGIEPKDLQTSNFNIQPKYTYHRPKNNEEQKPPRIIGYTVSNNLTVLIRDLAAVGDILDRSVTLGVNNGGQIQFGNDNPKEAIAAARAEAMKDAIARADTLLEAAGASRGKILDINESFQNPRPMPMAKGRMMAEAAMADSVPVEGGQNAYSITVSVSWEINQ